MEKGSSTAVASREAREARRRRILERSSDRLALITGDRKLTPPPPPPPSPSVFTPALEVIPRDDHLSSQEKAPYTTTISSETSMQYRSVEHENPNTPAPSTVADDTDVAPTMPYLMQEEPKGRTLRQFKRASVSRLVRRSLDASQVIRVLSASTIALFLVMHSTLSACDCTLRNLFVPWVVLQWPPLMLVLITNAMLTIGTCFLLRGNLTSQIEEEQQQQDQSGGLGAASQALDLATQLEGVLNTGLLMKKVIDAVSLDCCIYVVVLTCGLCVTQLWLPFLCTRLSF